MNAEIHGVMLASVPGAEWPIRIERLKKDADYLTWCFDVLTQHQEKVKSMVSHIDRISLPIHETDLDYQLKERLDLNSGTRSLIIAIFASIYIPLAFISSYFGMNARGFTDGGLTSTSTFWKVSIPLVIASIIVPVAFSGLLIRNTMQIAFYVKASLDAFKRLRYYLPRLYDCLLCGCLCLCAGLCLTPPMVKWMICCGDDDSSHPGRPGCVHLAQRIFRTLKQRFAKTDERQNDRQSFSNDNEGVSNQSIEMA